MVVAHEHDDIDCHHTKHSGTRKPFPISKVALKPPGQFFETQQAAGLKDCSFQAFSLAMGPSLQHVRLAGPRSASASKNWSA